MEGQEEGAQEPAKPMPFKEWCEVNGRAWIGASEEAFERNCQDYEKYLESFGRG